MEMVFLNENKEYARIWPLGTVGWYLNGKFCFPEEIVEQLGRRNISK
jgi:hypothetical protein